MLFINKKFATILEFYKIPRRMTRKGNFEVLELSKSNKEALCQQLPKIYQFHGTKAFNGFIALQKRVLSLMKSTAHEKYDLLLEQYPALFQRVSKTTIAHYLAFQEKL